MACGLRDGAAIHLAYPEPYFFRQFRCGIATYLKFAVEAHLAAGREVHVLTWITDATPTTVPDDADFQPLTRDSVTIVHLDGRAVRAQSLAGTYSKTASDLLLPHLLRLIESFCPDVIEGSEYLFLLHSYLEGRRSGAIAHNIPVITFNHGLTRDIRPAKARMADFNDLRVFACEEQVLSWSDHVFTPSRWASKNIAPLRNLSSPPMVVAEPFHADHWYRRSQFDGQNFAYFGRITFEKGLDRCANFLSGISSDWPISQILFVGGENEFPFRRPNAREFMRDRLGEKLTPQTQFVDEVDRSKLQEFLCGSDFFLNFSRTETFSYTTVEAIQMGMIPVVFADSAMAELLPDNLRERVTLEGPPFRFPDALQKLKACVQNYRDWLPEI